LIINKQLDNGFPYLEIQNKHAEAKIALQGAHLFHYKMKHKPALLWLSKASYFEEGKAIRGGVPICFPWFGKNKEDPSLAQHGFARTSLWRVRLEEELSDGSTHVRLELTSSTETLALWSYTFKLALDITIGKELTMALTTTNTDTNPFEISTALHTYFYVSNIDTIVIEGLDNRVYYNNLDGKNYTQKGDIYVDQEIDRVYLDSSETVTLFDADTKVKIQQEGSNSMVVWNPWQDKSKQMADMYDDGYENMVCIESCNAREDARVLNPGEIHVLKAIISQNVVSEDVK